MRRASMKPSTRFVAFIPATRIQMRASETYSTVTESLLPPTFMRNVRKPKRGSVALTEPNKTKKRMPELIRAKPEARLMIEPGRLKFFAITRNTVKKAKRVNSERKAESPIPYCVRIAFV